MNQTFDLRPHSQQQQNGNSNVNGNGRRQREVVSLPWQSTDASGMPSLIGRDSRQQLAVTPYSYGMFLGTDGSRPQHMLSAMESCVVKAGISGVLGGGMGLLFGLFFNSMENPFAADPRVMELSTRDQIKYSWRQMKVKSTGMAKNFAAVGILYSGIECVVEKKRGKHDIYNVLTAGCMTGGLLAAKGGATATLAGCAGFMAFSYAIEKWMESSDT